MSLLRPLRFSASADRLGKLLQERLAPDADKAAIDARIDRLFGEDWAVMFTDLAGFSRNVDAFGIVHFLQVIHESHRLLIPCVDAHDGILVKTEGDSLLLLFRTPGSAVSCAREMLGTLRPYNGRRPEEEQVRLCVGIGFGRLLKIGDDDVFGAQVNAASKLGEDTAGPEEILVTGAVADAVSLEPPSRWAPLDGPPPPGARAAYRLVDAS